MVESSTEIFRLVNGTPILLVVNGTAILLVVNGTALKTRQIKMRRTAGLLGINVVGNAFQKIITSFCVPIDSSIDSIALLDIIHQVFFTISTYIININPQPTQTKQHHVTIFFGIGTKEW